MSIAGISDTVTQALHQAINGLDARQQAISSNVANLETPNFLAREVNFEDSLRSALQDGDVSEASVSRSNMTVSQSLAATRLNGNNVNIDFELLSGSETVLRQKLVVQALNAKYQLLRTAMGTSA